VHYVGLKERKIMHGTDNIKFAAACLSDATAVCEPKNIICSAFLKYVAQKLNVNCNEVNQNA
jgi:hypothetical protein